MGPGRLRWREDGRDLVSFAGIALLVSLTPGPATALVVRSAALHGRRQALHVVLGIRVALERR